jgi:hypothetical protein
LLLKHQTALQSSTSSHDHHEDPRASVTWQVLHGHMQVPVVADLSGPSVTGQAGAQAVGNTLWERIHASWGSKSPAAVLDSTIRQRYAGEGKSCTLVPEAVTQTQHDAACTA